MDGKEKDQEGDIVKMLPETRKASGRELTITISNDEVDPEADIKTQPPKGSPSNDPAGLKESVPAVLPKSPDPPKILPTNEDNPGTSGPPVRSMDQKLHSFPREHAAIGGFPGNESISSIWTSSPTPKAPPTVLPGEQEEDYFLEENYEKFDLKKERCTKLRVDLLIEWVAALGISGCFIASLTVKKLREIAIWDLQLWKWCLLLNVIFCGMLVANWFKHFVDFISRRNFMQRTKDLPFVHRLQRSLQVFIWLCLVLLAWASLFNHGVERTKASKKILDLVTRTLISALVGSFLWLLKTLSLEILESKFRVDAFFDRIQESLTNEHVLRRLSGPPFGLHFWHNKMFKDIKDKAGIDIKRLCTMKKEDISSWTMKVLADHITSSGLSIFFTAPYDESDGVEGRGSDEEKTITNEMEAVAAAYHIFRNVAMPGAKYINEEDLQRFMTREEMEVLFSLLDEFETGSIGRRAIKKLVVKVYRDWKALSFTLNDTRRAVAQLNKVLSGILVVVGVIIWLLLMKITTSETIAIFLTAAAFAFSNTFKTVFEAAVFIFGVHPFDVGDRCVVDGIPLVVEEIDILTTVFLNPDNEKIYYPNSVLATKPISNYYRSPEMYESLDFSIAFAIPLERIDSLKAKIKNYLKNTSPHWDPEHSIVITETDNENKLKITLRCLHTMNFQDLDEKNRRRSELVIEMKKIFEELDIQCSMAKK